MRRPIPPSVTVVAAVVGGGVLFLPGLVRSTAGPAAQAAWAYQLALAAPLLATSAALGLALPGATGTGTVLARALGPWWEDVLAGFYVVGVPAGQVAVCLVGGAYLRGALAWPGSDGGAGRWPAFVALAVAVAVIATGRRSGERVRLALFAVVVVLSVGAGVEVLAGPHGGLVPPHPLRGGVAPAGHGAFLLLFAFLGWESAIALRSARGRRGLARACVVGWVAVAALSALLATAAWAGGASSRPFWLLSSPFGGPAGRVVDAVAFAACAVFCARNLTAAGGLAARLARDGPGLLPSRLAGPEPAPWRRGALLVACGTAAGLVLAVTGALRVDQALAVPDAMILAVYLLLSVAGARVLRGPSRAAALVAFAGCALLLPFAGVALAFPVAVVALVLVARRRASAPARGPGPGGVAGGGPDVDDPL
jgi:amino acid efflux transporter